MPCTETVVWDLGDGRESAWSSAAALHTRGRRRRRSSSSEKRQARYVEQVAARRDGWSRNPVGRALMRRGGSRYVREDATSSVQLAGVMLGTGRARQVHPEHGPPG